jgi:hypothetical protein
MPQRGILACTHYREGLVTMDPWETSYTRWSQIFNEARLEAIPAIG